MFDFSQLSDEKDRKVAQPANGPGRPEGQGSPSRPPSEKEEKEDVKRKEPENTKDEYVVSCCFIRIKRIIVFNHCEI